MTDCATATLAAAEAPPVEMRVYTEKGVVRLLIAKNRHMQPAAAFAIMHDALTPEQLCDAGQDLIDRGFCKEGDHPLTVFCLAILYMAAGMPLFKGETQE